MGLVWTLDALALDDDYTISVIGNEEARCKFYDNRVNTIYKDSEGFVWVGTGASVERVGGKHSLVYRFQAERNDPGPAPFLVNALLENQKADFWVGTIQGVWRLNHRDCLAERAFADEINFPVEALAKDSAHRVYIGTSNGLYIYDGSQLRHVVLAKDNAQVSGNSIVGVEVCSPRQVWLLTPNGLVLCDGASGALKSYACPFDAGKFTCSLKVGDFLFLGTDKGRVIKFDLHKYSFAPFWQETTSAIMDLSYERNLLAIATMGSGIRLVSLVSGVTQRSFMYEGESQPGILTDVTSSVLVSRGNVWCGTGYYVGMNLLRRCDRVFTRYSKGPFATKNYLVRSALRTKDHTFIGTREGFYCIDERTEKTAYVNMGNAPAGQLRSNIIFSFHELGGQVLVGTCDGGLSIYNPRTGQFSQSPLTATCTTNDIFMFEEDGKGTLWLATSDGLYAYDEKTQTVREYNASNSGMPGNIVYGIKIDSKKRFWVATDKGLALFDVKTGECRPSGLPAAYAKQAARSIFEGKDGTLLINMLNYQLVVLKDGNPQNAYLMPAFECINVAQDDKGFYWIGNSNGMLRVDEQLRHYTLYADMDGTAVCPGTLIAKEQGKLWICTAKGLYAVDPRRAHKNSPMRITEIFVNGKRYIDHGTSPADSLLVLKSDENSVTFHFTSLGYEEPASLKLQYMLEGRDSTWQELVGEDQVSFFGLPSGNYVFKVRKMLDMDSVDEVAFRVEASRSWMKYFVAILLPLMIVFYLYYKKRRQRPHLLPSTDGTEEEPVATVAEHAKESYTRVSGDEAQKVVDALTRYMEEQKPYLNVDLKQSEVATAIGHSTFMLSAVFSRHLQTGYYDYINAYRVNEFRRLVAEGLYKKYTLETLALKCGFKSKASFFRAVKKFTGSTPSEYIKQVSK